MHISAKADYGMRALLELTVSYAEDPKRLVKGEAIATAQDIPMKFLEGILRQLRQYGIVGSQRGADGGYRLDRDPTQVTIADVVRALDGPLATLADVAANKLPAEVTGLLAEPGAWQRRTN